MLFVFGSFALLLSSALLNLPLGSNAQSQSPAVINSKVTSKGGDVGVTVSVTATVQVSNATLESKDRMLRNAITSFLTSGHNVLKATPTEQPVVKTKVTNQISNTTQSVEGVEATNAVLGVEISKALKTVTSSIVEQNQTSVVTIGTSSTCKPTPYGSISCENSVTIKH